MFICLHILADVAELADAIDLGSIVLVRGGSSPFIRTNRTTFYLKLSIIFLFKL